MLKRTVVADVKQLFVEGATPSRLMQCIAAAHPDDPRLHLLIMDYFREAFQVPLLRNVIPGADYSPDLRHAHYNRDVVPDLVHRSQGWQTGNLTGSWLDGVAVHSFPEHVARLSESRWQELDRIWDGLTNEERQFIVRKIAMKDYYWDALKCLALLAERLQQQVVELQNRLQHETKNSEGPGSETIAPISRGA